MVPVVIPSYEPDQRLIGVIEGLLNLDSGLSVLVVNDGSGEKYTDIFNKVKDIPGVTLIEHPMNRGKGRALKTAFEYLLGNHPDLQGCVTADSDGQHRPEDILKVAAAMKEHPDALTLGVRDFSHPDVPDKSRFGNNLTKKVFKRLFKADLTDTQTGLRGIPTPLMRMFLKVRGERFEYETNMLIKAVNDPIAINEVPIDTVYDDKVCHSTHFRPVVDSVKIYSLFFRVFLKFALSSVSSCILDIILFQLLCLLLRDTDTGIGYVLLSTIIARVISATYNFCINYKYVFRSHAGKWQAAVKYILLAVFIMICSGVFTSRLFPLIGAKYELLAKIPVDTGLFLFSYLIQKKFVYK